MEVPGANAVWRALTVLAAAPPVTLEGLRGKT